MTIRQLSRFGVQYAIEQALTEERGHEPTSVDLLVAADEVREGLIEWQRALAAGARDQGMTWQEIGDALGISRQAARERLGRRS